MIFRKSKFLKIFSVVISLLIIIFILLYFFVRLSFSFDVSPSEYPIIKKLFPVIRIVRKIPDILYFPYIFKQNNLIVYSLEISDKDFQFLNENLPPAYSDELILSEQFREYVPAKFKVDNKEYSVEVRYRGDTNAHWSANKKSWLVKFDKDDLFHGMRKIHLILPFDRGYVLEHFNNYRAEKMGLIVPKSGFANFYVNGKSNGVYFVIESLDGQVLAKNNQPDEANLYTLSNNEQSFGQIDKFSSIGLWEKQVSDSISSLDNFAEFGLLLDLLNNAEDKEFFDKIPNLLNMDKFYKWQIHSLLVNSTHQKATDLYFYFNNALGKFELIPWDVEQLALVPCIDENYNPLIARIFKNPEFVEQRNRLLWDYVKDDKNLEDDLRFFDQTYQNIRTAYYQDNLKVKSNLQFDSEVKKRRQMYVDNYKYIQQTLKQSSAFANVSIGADDKSLAILDLETQSFGAVAFQNIELEFTNSFESDMFWLYYDSNGNNVFDSYDMRISQISYDNQSEKFLSMPFEFPLYMQREIKSEQLVIDLKPIKYRFFVAPNRNDLEIKQVDLGLVNALTREKMDPTIHYLDQRTFTYFEQINQSFEQFHNQHPYFTRDIQDPNQINLLTGNYYINKTVIIPKGFSLKIEPGAVLNFAPSVSLISYGPVLAQGIQNMPIKFISQSQNEPWGVFGILGEYSEKSVFEYCLFENGKNDYINGVFYSGQLSVHYADVVIRNCEFRYAKGDDGLNVKKGRVEIVANYFYENGFDGLDLDWASGSVENNQFLNNGNDGLDLSGAKNLLIAGNIVNNSGDKCLSVGERSEKTTIIFNNLFSGCDMGVAVKDDSKVVLLNNTIVNNKVGLAVYEKKPVFGGALPSVINTLIWDNEKSIEIDGKSDVSISYSNIQWGYMGENNLDKEPIFKDNYLLVNNQQNQDLIIGGSVKILETIMNIQKQIAPIGLID